MCRGKQGAADPQRRGAGGSALSPTTLRAAVIAAAATRLPIGLLLNAGEALYWLAATDSRGRQTEEKR